MAVVDDAGWVRPRGGGTVETAGDESGGAQVTIANEVPEVALNAPTDGAAFFVSV